MSKAAADNKLLEATINVRLLPGENLAELSLAAKSGPTLTARFAAAELEPLIAALAGIRSQMTPEPPRAYSDETNAYHLEQTDYSFAVDRVTGEVTLALRTTGLGWIVLSLDPDEAVGVGNRLLEAQGFVGKTRKPN